MGNYAPLFLIFMIALFLAFTSSILTAIMTNPHVLHLVYLISKIGDVVK